MEFSETFADLAEQGSNHLGKNESILDDPLFENRPLPSYISLISFPVKPPTLALEHVSVTLSTYDGSIRVVHWERQSHLVAVTPSVFCDSSPPFIIQVVVLGRIGS